jgi:hypothetical protein
VLYKIWWILFSKNRERGRGFGGREGRGRIGLWLGFCFLLL